MNPREELSELRRVARIKRTDNRPPAVELGAAMVTFFKQSVQKRQDKFGKIAGVWSALVPELLNAHCALESFLKGQLVVLVDSASHLYELKQLLLAGLQQQILTGCKSHGLRKITLRAGRWYDQPINVSAPGAAAGPAGRRIRFD